MIRNFESVISQVIGAHYVSSPGAQSASRWSRAMARPLLAGLTLLGVASPARADVFDGLAHRLLIGFAAPGARTVVDSVPPLDPLFVEHAGDQAPLADIVLDGAAGHFGSADFTVSHWFLTNFREPGGLGDVIGNRTSFGHGNFFAVRMRGDGILTMELDQDENGTNYGSASAEGHPVNDGCWHHLVYVRYERVFGMYLDGVPVALGIAPSPARIDGTSPFRIGGAQISYADLPSLSALYQDVRIYTRALRYAEIQQLSARTNPPDPLGIDACTPR